MSKQLLVKLRPYRSSDRSFVFKSFMEGLRNGNDTFKKMVLYEFQTTYQKLIEQLIAMSETKVTIACLKEDDDVILGFSITRPETIDWCFVKPSWRSLGIARDLVAHITPIRVSHITKPGEAIRLKHNLKFDPFT